MTFDLWNQICSSFSRTWHFLFTYFTYISCTLYVPRMSHRDESASAWFELQHCSVLLACVRSAVGSHTHAVFTCGLNGPGWGSVALDSSPPLCCTWGHTGGGGFLRRHDPDRCSPSPPETAVQITQLEQIIQTWRGGGGHWSYSGDHPSKWQSFQHVEFV